MKQPWRSLEELQGSPEFSEWIHREFPREAGVWQDAVSRREFLRVAAAGLALAGLQSCTREPDEKIVPHVRRPEFQVPGVSRMFATSITFSGYATGVLVKSYEGRPVKVEGNPDHPASLGSTDPFTEAAILELYDPDRSQTVLRSGGISTWGAFQQELKTTLEAQKAARGAGLRIVTGTVTSPTLDTQLRGLLETFPDARWLAFEPIGRERSREGARRAFGEDAACRYRFSEASAIVSLEADFLAWGPGRIRYTRDFSERRRPDAKDGPSRLFVVEGSPSLTGAMADRRLPLDPRAIPRLARQLADAVEGKTSTDPWIAPASAALAVARTGALVIAGETQPPEVHAIAHRINDRLGSKAVEYTAPVESTSASVESLRGLAEELRQGQVEVLVLLGVNPAYDAPPELDFPNLLGRARWSVHLGLYDDETARLCRWHVPQAHDLESWADARAYDGTAGILQPLIAPLYSGRTAAEIVAAIAGRADARAHDLVRDHWRRTKGESGFEDFWQTSLHDGVVAGTALPARSMRLRSWEAPADDPAEGPVVAFRPDPTIWDGRFANNAWLQELPKPLTTLTWDNALLVAPATAAGLGIANGDVVKLEASGRSLEAPAWILPGQAPGVFTAPLGYGRARAGRVGTGAGFDAYRLRSASTPWTLSNVRVSRTGRRVTLAAAQNHNLMENRDLIRRASFDEYAKDPGRFRHEEDEPHGSLYPERESGDYAWGMVIDLGACIGCGACVVACQSENNIPTVGRTEVARGREMHWIRVDRYFDGEPDNPAILHQPVPCMHCETAPCEVVCPVAATVHSDEGLNEMVYNRCVGTRYCSNNCPYKVRRFNFLQYSDLKTPSLMLGRNPQVTVRERGVMEKCSYCVQRINSARITAKKEDRAIRDGEVVTACQSACPAKAITFGNLKDPGSAVSRRKAEPRHYPLLGFLGTRPRTTYLARLSHGSE